MVIGYYYQEFLDNLLSEKNVSDSTITSYTTDFKILKSFLSKNNIQPTLNNLITPIIMFPIHAPKEEQKLPIYKRKRTKSTITSTFKICTFSISCIKGYSAIKNAYFHRGKKK